MRFAETTRRLVNGVWVASCSRGHRRFRAALERVEQTQRDNLLALLRRNAHTRFGTAHRFGEIRSVTEYQAHVPITPYEALQPHIDAIAEGAPRVLTAEPVTRFQPTSGSTAGTKLIPWTAEVGAEFRRGIDPWIHALYRRLPELRRGTAYWSVSPPGAAPRAFGKLPVGFDNDAGYLGFLGQRLFSQVSAVPASVAHCRDLDEFRTRTLVALLADTELRLISVWSPTFLTTLLADCLGRHAEFVTRLRRSTMPGAAKRADQLASHFRNDAGPTVFAEIWPKLAHVSCWTHGPSEAYAAELRRYFPSVEIQGKGLLATEAFVSLPYLTDRDPILAVNSHFFEFQSADTGKLHLAHELATGAEYEVIVTTAGGLYRYPLGDRIRVTGFIGGAPCLRFLGRGQQCSDHFGEKLDALFVQQVIDQACATLSITPGFALLAPTKGQQATTAYSLFLTANSRIEKPEHLRKAVETGLTANFHYQHCRHLGQLAPARLFLISATPTAAADIFLREMAARGQQAGAIKPSPLDNRFGWERQFPGEFLHRGSSAPG